MSAPGTVKWTDSGQTGMTPTGWMIRQSTSGFLVFDANDRYIGRFDSRVAAEEATR